MKKIYFIFIICNYISVASSQSTDTLLVKKIVSFHPLSLIEELYVSEEVLINEKYTYELGVAYVYNTLELESATGDNIFPKWAIYHGNGFSIRTGIKKYFHKTAPFGSAFKLQIMYSYIGFNNNEIDPLIYRGSILTNKQMFSSNFIIERQLQIRKRFLFAYYGGVGLGNIRSNFIIYYPIGFPSKFSISKEDQFHFSIILGVSFGIGLK